MVVYSRKLTVPTLIVCMQANEYPAVARTMLIVCQKHRISRQITLNRRQNLSVLIKNMQILR